MIRVLGLALLGLLECVSRPAECRLVEWEAQDKRPPGGSLSSSDSQNVVVNRESGVAVGRDLLIGPDEKLLVRWDRPVTLLGYETLGLGPHRAEFHHALGKSLSASPYDGGVDSLILPRTSSVSVSALPGGFVVLSRLTYVTCGAETSPGDDQ